MFGFYASFESPTWVRNVVFESIWIKGVAAAILVGVLLVALIVFETRSVVVARYTVEVEGLPPAFDGFTILHLSDLHSKRYGQEQAGLRRLIGAQDFDAVVMTGDFVDRNNPDPDPTREILPAFDQKPVYSVPGNHELQTGFRPRREPLAPGVTDLTNQATPLTLDKETLWFIGVNDSFVGRDRLEEALADVDGDGPRVLLSHSPGLFKKAQEAGIDLMLSGHTHAGQIRLPIIGALYIPGQGFFPRYDHGLFTARETRMIISAGLGETFLRFRFLSRPEIGLIELKPAADPL